jgi:hypothetical protein
MEWKVRLEGDENTISELSKTCTTPAARVSRDGNDWFLESNEFAMFTDHLEVKEKAKGIIQSLVSASATPQAAIGIGVIYRIHYDNSKTAFR